MGVVAAVAAALACVPPAAARAAHAPVPRVIGGSAPGPSAGYVVALLRDGRFFCSGSVIAPTSVLTAAHCLTGTDPHAITVLAGKTNIGDTVSGETIPVTAGVASPDFGVAPIHDLAVLTLERPTSAPPIQLATAAEDAVATVTGARLTVLGFGRRNPVSSGHPRVGRLRSLAETVRGTCPRSYGIAFLPEAGICAGGARIRSARAGKIHRGVCGGDSGGPLVAESPAGPRLVGVVSVGLRNHALLCGLKGADLFQRVAPELGFIGAAAFGVPEPAPLVTFSGPGMLPVAPRLEFPVQCSEDCSLTVTMTLAIGRAKIPPQTVSGNFAAGETASPFLSLNRVARRLLRNFPRASVLKAEVAATGPGGATEHHLRLFGFHR
jgi:trypsin